LARALANHLRQATTTPAANHLRKPTPGRRRRRKAALPELENTGLAVLFDTLASAGGIDRAAITSASKDLLAALGDLLTRAQRAGAVRADITVTDLKAIMTGAFAMERAAAGPPGRMITVICDGLRPLK
jgi:hypothetical protein